MARSATKKSIKHSQVKAVSGNYKRRLNPRIRRKYPSKRRNYRRKSYKKRSLKRKSKWMGNDNPWTTRKVTFTDRLLGGGTQLTPWQGLSVGTYRNNTVTNSGSVDPNSNRPYWYKTDGTPPTATMYYGTDLYYAMQCVGYQDTDGTPTDVNNQRQKIYIRNSTASAQIRNNTNVAVNLRFFKYHPRKDRVSDGTFDTFKNAWNTAKDYAGFATTYPPLNTSPYDLPGFTRCFKIDKSWRIRLLPGEKTTVYLKNKFIMGEPGTIGSTYSTERWSKFLGMLAYSDPVHSSANPSSVSTASFQLDIIYNYSVSAKKLTQPEIVPFTGLNSVYNITDPCANAAFANEPKPIETVPPP